MDLLLKFITKYIICIVYVDLCTIVQHCYNNQVCVSNNNNTFCNKLSISNLRRYIR